MENVKSGVQGLHSHGANEMEKNAEVEDVLSIRNTRDWRGWLIIYASRRELLG